MPYGVWGTETKHYSISIIRDRGIDTNALECILRRDKRPAAGLVFVDGWTGKGVITRELKRAVKAWNATHPERLDDRLYVVADIGGVADVAATLDDYVIPSGIMNATVSGLVSRSILNGAISQADFHGCVYYGHLEPYDMSNWFLDTVTEAFDSVLTHHCPAKCPRPTPRRRTGISPSRDDEVGNQRSQPCQAGHCRGHTRDAAPGTGATAAQRCG